jgi:hypothetical protein
MPTPTQTDLRSFTEYFPVGFTEYVNRRLSEAGNPMPPGESLYVEQDVVIVIVNSGGDIGRILYCAVDNYGNTQFPPFDLYYYPSGSEAITSATTCLEGPLLVSIGESTFEIQTNAAGAIASVTLDDDIAQSEVPKLMAITPDGFIGDETNGVIGQNLVLFLNRASTFLAEAFGPALVEGVELVPIPTP